MHIVAARPLYLEPCDVPTEVIKQETDIFKELAEKEMAAKKSPTKPEMIERMIQGKVNKRLSEICLVGQNHVAEEGQPVVSKYMLQTSKTLGTDLTILSFKLWSLGQASSVP